MTDINGTPMDAGDAAMEPAPVPTAVDEQPERPGNVVLGILAGAGAGVVVAVVYALVARFLDREIGWLALFIGIAVAMATVTVAKRADAVLGLVSAVVAAACFVFAIFLTFTLIFANEFGISVGDSASILLEEPVEILKAYFEEDFLSYVFAFLAVASAFWYASGMRTKKD